MSVHHKTINLLEDVSQFLGDESMDFVYDLKDFFIKKKSNFIMLTLRVNSFKQKKVDIFYCLDNDKAYVIFHNILPHLISGIKLLEINTDPNIKNNYVYNCLESIQKQKIQYLILYFAKKINLKQKDVNNYVKIHMKLNEKKYIKDFYRILDTTIQAIAEETD